MGLATHWVFRFPVWLWELGERRAMLDSQTGRLLTLQLPGALPDSDCALFPGAGA